KGKEFTVQDYPAYRVPWRRARGIRLFRHGVPIPEALAPAPAAPKVEVLAPEKPRTPDPKPAPVIEATAAPAAQAEHHTPAAEKPAADKSDKAHRLPPATPLAAKPEPDEKPHVPAEVLHAHAAHADPHEPTKH